MCVSVYVPVLASASVSESQPRLRLVFQIVKIIETDRGKKIFVEVSTDYNNLSGQL